MPPVADPSHWLLRRRKPRHCHAHRAATQPGYPQGSGEYLALPAIYRPQMVPAYEVNRTFDAKCELSWDTPGAWKYRLYKQMNSRRAPGSARTRVNVVNHNLGNKACNSETTRIRKNGGYYALISLHTPHCSQRLGPSAAWTAGATRNKAFTHPHCSLHFELHVPQ